MGIKFKFQLLPIEECDAFGQPGNLSQNWMGLTDGWYWIELDGVELFHYSQEILEYWERIESQKTLLPYAPYYIMRLWEDAIDLLPRILESLPKALVRKIRVYGSWDNWEKRVDDLLDSDPTVDDDTYVLTVEWWRKRRLSSGHLKYGPAIPFWNDGKLIHVEWDNRDRILNGIPVWAAQQGQQSIPVNDFIEAIQFFDAEFINAMGQRVEQVRQHWPRPDVSIDIDALEYQHQRESAYLAQELNRRAEIEPTDWKKVLEAIAKIEAHPLFLLSPKIDS